MGDAVEAYKGRKADLIVAQALELYDQGKEIEEAAKELDVPARTIYRWLSHNAVEQWHAAQKGRSLAEYDLARKRRDAARVAMDDLKQTLKREKVKNPAERKWRLAHAREVLHAADRELTHQEWQLERVMKRIYGNDAAPDTTGKVSITLNLGPREPLDVVAEQPKQE